MKNKNPLVSIILPVYNVEKYLERCLNSLMDQSYKNIEVIAINDGSTDNSLIILVKASKYDKRIKIINKGNGGQASARNLGLKIARGDYIMMVDSDDYLAANTILECVKELSDKEYDLIIFDFFNVDHKGKKKYIQTGTKLHNAISVPWNKFYCKKLWESYRFPEGFWYEDLGIVPVVVASAKNIKKIDKPLYNYYISRPDSQSNMLNPEKLVDMISMVENVYDEMKENGSLFNNRNELECLFIEHLLYELVFKLIYVKDSDSKKNIMTKVKASIQRYFPDWKESPYIKKRGLKNKLKLIIINGYLNGHFQCGNILWKYPKKFLNFLRL